MRGAGPGARFLYSFIKSCTRQSEFKICCQGASPPLNSLPSVDGRPSADTAVHRWRRVYALGGRGHWPPSAAGECRPHGGGKRGKTTRVFFPLLTPQTFLRTRLPAVARLKSGGPQGRLVLQENALDGSGVFRSANQALCTGWPRTVMRGGLRKKNSGQ